MVQPVLAAQFWLLAVGGAPPLDPHFELLLEPGRVGVLERWKLPSWPSGFAAAGHTRCPAAFLLLGPVIDLKLIGLFGVLAAPAARHPASRQQEQVWWCC